MKCLVTSYNGTVNGANLVNVGECIITVNSTKSNQEIIVPNLGGIEYYCEKEHKLGEETVGANVRKVSSGWTTISSIEPGLYRFHFLDKYKLSALLFTADVVDFVGLSYLLNLTQLNLTSKEYFDFNTLAHSKKLQEITLNGENIVGEISALKDAVNLSTLNIRAMSVNGNLEDLSEVTSITTLILKANVKVKASDLQRNENLATAEISYFINDGNFGDIATLSPKLKYLLLGNSPSVSWSSRPSSSNIIAIQGKPKFDNVDKMLQDQAQCQKAITGSEASWFKGIDVIGTRTSASDAAVETLQQKGYTVTVRPA